jgi:phage terminase large subunit-like protein
MEGYTYFFTYDETIPHTKRPKAFMGMNCAMGVDLSQGDDFCAFTFLFPLSRERFGVKTRSYISSLTMTKLPGALRHKYDTFRKEGSLHILEGATLDMMEVYDDLEKYIEENEYEVDAVGYDPYNAQEFIPRWEAEHGAYGVVKVIQGAKSESVPLGELKILAGERALIFDQELMSFTLGNAVTQEDTNGNRKLHKMRKDEKIDNVAALMDAYIAFKANKEAFE